MELPQQTPGSQPDQDTAEVGPYAGPSVSLCARLWEYRGPQERLVELDWGTDDAIATLIREVLRDGQGKIAGLRGNLLISHFKNSFNALAAAKSLQVRLLTLHRNPESHQMVAAVAVLGNDAESSSVSAPVEIPSSLLIEANSAQILVSAGIYEAAKTVPGFQFGATPARGPGEHSEALYELLWTDESTYSHVRKTGQGAVLSASGTKRYEIQSELGRGAMGVVYEAVDNVIGRTVALKTISIQRNFADHNELVERLKLEAKAAGSLDHPNIITIYDVGQDEEFVYLSMQFVAGKTLARLIEEGKLPPLATLLTWVDQICSAVGFAHQRGVIHRDLKPANFMITADETVKVLDFGIAKLGDATVTQTGVVVGTPTYMAPEQAMGKKLDQRSDIFTLGTVFYELFTRERPFKGDVAAVLYKLIHEDPTPPSIINPSLPHGIDRIIRKALAKNPADRYQTCEEMRDAFREQTTLLQAAAATQIAVATSPSASTGQPRPPSSMRIPIVASSKRRSTRPFWIGVLAVVLAAAALAGVWAVRVKSQTGSFPARLQRMIVAVRGVRTHRFLRDRAKDKSTLPQQAIEVPPTTPNNSITPAAVSDSKDALPNSPANAETTSATTPGAAPAEVPDSAAAKVPATPPASTMQPVSTPPVTAAKSVNAQATTDESGTKSSASPTTAETSDEVKPVDASASTQAKHHTQPASVKMADDKVRVDGFSRAEIPDLLRRAGAAAGAGDYSLALYEYNLVLKLDHHNATARNGVARVMAAKSEKLQR
jgi:serine/threonine protein kinase